MLHKPDGETARPDNPLAFPGNTPSRNGGEGGDIRERREDPGRAPRRPTTFLFLAVCAASFFFVMVFMLADYNSHVGEARLHARHMLDTTARTVVMQIELFFKEKLGGLDTLARKSGAMLSGPATSSGGGWNSGIFSGWIETVADLSGYDRVMFFDSKGVKRFPGTHDAGGTRDDDWIAPVLAASGAIRKTLETGETHWVWLSPDQGNLILITQGVKDENGRITGAVLAGITPTPLRTIVDKNERTFMGYRLSMVDRKGRSVFGDSNRPLIPMDRLMPSGSQGAPGHHPDAGEKSGELSVALPIVLAGSSPPEWYVAAETRDHSYYLNIMKDHRRAVLVVAGAFFFILALNFVQLNLTSREVRVYATWAAKATRGQIEPLAFPKGNSDMYFMGEAVGGLADRMKEIQGFCVAASKGDFRNRLPLRSEKDDLGLALNGVRDYFKTVYDRIGRITLGEYAPGGTGMFENDELDPLLSRLKETLRKMSEESYRQITGTYVQMELIRQLSGNLDLDRIVSQVLSFICSYSGAQIGVLYVIDKEENAFFLKGTFGCLRRDFPERIRAGEGLCGQAAAEKKPLALKGEGIAGPLVKSGLSESSPASIFAYPFQFGDEVVAVMEIGALGDFKRDVEDILGKNSESVSIGIQSALSRSLTEKLLEKTMQQAESLKVQQEKLRAANQELEDQAFALKESQTRLLAREEELYRANEALRTHSRNLEETKAVLENKAEELAKSNRYKTEFLANMSHELRTPLNSIILLSGILSEKAANGPADANAMEKFRTFSSVINASGKDLLNLIDEVLDLTRIASGDMAVTLTRHRLAETGRVMKKYYERTALEKNIEFQVHLEPDLPEFILTDSLRLERILKSLLTNAFKYTQIGRVTLRIKKAELSSAAPEPDLNGSASIEFSVEDTGEGIPENMQGLVFEAFKQVDGSITRKHGGAGLGLALAREFARLLQGEILLSSTLGEGSTFRLYLPEAWRENGKSDNVKL